MPEEIDLIAPVEGKDGISVIRASENCRGWNGIQYKLGMSAKNVGSTKLSMNVATILDAHLDLAYPAIAQAGKRHPRRLKPPPAVTQRRMHVPPGLGEVRKIKMCVEDGHGQRIEPDIASAGRRT